MKVTKKEIVAFVLGATTLLLFEIFVSWNQSKESFKNGFKSHTKVISTK